MQLKVGVYRAIRFAQGVIGQCLRTLPGAWQFFGLPGRTINSLKDWVGSKRTNNPDRWTLTHGPHYEAIIPPVTVKRPAPRTIGPEPIPREFTIDRHTAHPEFFLAVLPGGRVLGPDGTVITSCGRILGESTWPRLQRAQDRAWDAWKLPRCTEIRGRVYTIAMPGASGYYHWITEVLPRLSALDTLPAADSPILVNAPLSAWQEESLYLLGIDRSRIVVLGDRYLSAEVLLFPSIIGDPSPHPAACRWLRERYLPAGEPLQGGRRLYVTRRLARCRRVTNETELEPILKKYGFEIVEAERLSFAEQVRLFSEASHIAGPHGAGLANAIFAPTSCKILELFQPSYLLASTYKIATCLGQEYWYLSGSATIDDGRDSDNTRDMTIDCGNLFACLKEIDS